MKDWGKICRDLSSPDSSDAEDELNVLSVQKNATRVSEMMHGIIPGLDRSKAGAVAMGMNRTELISASLAKAFESSRHLNEFRSSEEEHDLKPPATDSSPATDSLPATDSSPATHSSPVTHSSPAFHSSLAFHSSPATHSSPAGESGLSLSPQKEKEK